MSEWYQMSAGEVLEKLESDPERGLTSAEAAKRLEQFGPNELVEKGSKSPWLILWDQMKEPMVIVLIVAAVVSLLLQEFEDAFIIIAIVVVFLLAKITTSLVIVGVHWPSLASYISASSRIRRNRLLPVESIHCVVNENGL